MVAVSANSILSEMHIAVHSAVMPFHSYLFRIRKTGNTETWTF